MKVKVNGVWLSQENVSTTDFLYGLLPDFTGNNEKYLKLVGGHLVFASAGGGSFSGTMDDIDNGTDYVKTENNYTDAEKSKLSGIASSATANSSDATLLARANHIGTQSADTITDGSTNKVFTAVEKTKLGNQSGTNTGDQDLSGLMVKSNNLSDLANASTARTNLGINTTANQTDTTDKRFVTDAQRTVIQNTSGTNSGDQISIAGITGTKAQFDTACSNGNFLYVGDITQYVAPELPMVKLVSTSDQSITAGYASIISYLYTIGNSFTTTVNDGAVLEIT